MRDFINVIILVSHTGIHLLVLIYPDILCYASMAGISGHMSGQTDKRLHDVTM